MPIERHNTDQFVSERHQIKLPASSGAAQEQRLGFLIVYGF